MCSIVPACITVLLVNTSCMVRVIAKTSVVSQKDTPAIDLVSQKETPLIEPVLQRDTPRMARQHVGTYSRDPIQASRRRAAIQAAFLENLAQFGNHTLASRAAGIDRDTARRWCESDPEFAEGYEQAQETATEVLESEAWRRAVHGTEYIRRAYWKGEVCGEDVKREYSDNLMQLLLRARAPHKYRETTNVDVRQVVKVVAGIDPSEVLGTFLGTTPALASTNDSSDE